MGEGGLAQPGRSIEKDVVKGFTPPFRRGDGDVQVVLYLVLSDEVLKTAGTEAGVKGNILRRRFS